LSRATSPTHAERLDALATELLERAAVYEANRDSRCVFTRAYALMTHRLSEDLERGALDDPAWVVALAEAFGARYIAALTAFDEQHELPDAWRAVFDTICPRRTSPIEDLVFAMAAHIVRDLPHALVAVGLDDAGRSHVHDFHSVNATMGRAVDEIQIEIEKRYAPYVRWLDRIGHAQDELLTNYGIRLSRGMAWYNATRLLDPASADAAAKSIERSPREFVEEVIKQPLLRILRLAVSVLRRWPKAAREA
jgi:hypothetical protein